MTAIPRLSVGLPVYNGERYLSQSLDALLGQSYGDFELIISDNASTDGTAEICHEYASRDTRIKYLKQPENIGAARNHNAVFHEAGGELFKWASCDDLYGRDLFRSSIEVLDENADVVLSHCRTAYIDSEGTLVRRAGYPLDTDSPDVVERFRSLLFGVGGDDDYGIIRSEVLRQTPLTESYYHADRTIVAEIALHGRFLHVPESLFFRREHPDRISRAGKTVRAWCVTMDPRRASRLRHPVVRLLAEYVWAYVTAIKRAPLSPEERRQCYGEFGKWLSSRAKPRRIVGDPEMPPEMPFAEIVSVSSLVAGQERA